MTLKNKILKLLGRKEVDLCQECMNSFTNWLNRGEEYESK